MGGSIARISRSGITKHLIALAFLTFPAFGGASAAEKTVSWWHEECGYSVSFNSGTVDEGRLRNTVHLIYGPPDFAAPFVGLPFNPQSVARLNLDHTTSECKTALDVAGRLDFLPLPGVEDYRHALMAEIKDTCDFETAEIRAFRDPSALRDYTPATACSPLVDALEGNGDIMAAFRATVDEQCSGDAARTQCVERARRRADNVDGKDWVRLYLIKFGWNNCATAYSSRNADSGKLEQMRADLEEQFRRAFKVTRNRCEATADGSGEPAADVAAAESAPARPAATAGKPRVRGCSLKRRGRRSESERDSCAAGNARRRAAARAFGLPTPYSAGWRMGDRSFTWH